MQELIEYLVYQIKQKDSNDRARGFLDRILDIVLLSNRYETMQYINDINDKSTYWIVSTHFGYLSAQWQDIGFIKLIKQKTEQFNGMVEDVYYERFIQNLQEAITVLDEEIENQL